MDIIEFRNRVDAVLADANRLLFDEGAPVRVSLRLFGTSVWHSADITDSTIVNDWKSAIEQIRHWRNAEAAVSARESGKDTPSFLQSLGDAWCGFTLAIHELREDDEEPACLAIVRAHLFMNADDARQYEALAA